MPAERIKKYDREHRVGNFTRERHRAYEIGRHASLSDVDLERGDVLPTAADKSDNGEYEIIDSWTEVVTQGKSDIRIARVVAVKYDTE